MAAQQRRLLTASTSKLSKADIITVLRQEEAWASLPFKTREHLYTLLPPPREGEVEPEPDPDVHPLQSAYKPYVEEELRRWQQDLKDGREGKKWREEATQAGRDRVEGKFDEWKEAEREQYWGKPKVEVQEEKENGKVDDEVEGAEERVVKDSQASSEM